MTSCLCTYSTHLSNFLLLTASRILFSEIYLLWIFSGFSWLFDFLCFFGFFVILRDFAIFHDFVIFRGFAGYFLWFSVIIPFRCTKTHEKSRGRIWGDLSITEEIKACFQLFLAKKLFFVTRFLLFDSKNSFITISAILSGIDHWSGEIVFRCLRWSCWSVISALPY